MGRIIHHAVREIEKWRKASGSGFREGVDETGGAILLPTWIPEPWTQHGDLQLSVLPQRHLPFTVFIPAPAQMSELLPSPPEHFP